MHLAMGNWQWQKSHDTQVGSRQLEKKLNPLFCIKIKESGC